MFPPVFELLSWTAGASWLWGVGWTFVSPACFSVLEKLNTNLFFFFTLSLLGGETHWIHPQQERFTFLWFWLQSCHQPVQQSVWSVLLRQHQGLELCCGRREDHDHIRRAQQVGSAFRVQKRRWWMMLRNFKSWMWACLHGDGPVRLHKLLQRNLSAKQ